MTSINLMLTSSTIHVHLKALSSFFQGGRTWRHQNFSAIQWKFNQVQCVTNNCIYRQWYCKIITIPNPFEVWAWSLEIKKLLNLFYKNIVFQICVDNLHSSTAGVATYLQLDGKFHARTYTCTCSDSIDENQAKIHAYVRVAMFLFQDF